MADPKKINPKYIKSGELTIGTGYFNTGSFVNRPSVNGSGVLLVGEAAGGSNTDVTVTGSSVLSTADLTGVGNVTVTLDGSTVKISGTAGAATAAGSDRQIQFNDGGSNLGADEFLTYTLGSVGAVNYRSLNVSGSSSDSSHGVIQIMSQNATEGGQFTLGGGTSYPSNNWTIDSYENRLRFFRGATEIVNYTSDGLEVIGNISGQHFKTEPYDLGSINGAITIDFNNGSIQQASLNGNVSSFAVSNAVAGEGVVVKFYTATTRTIAPGSSLSFLGELPTGLSAGMTGALSLLAFSSSDIMAGFLAQTAIG